MRARPVAALVAILATVALGGWLVARRGVAGERAHDAAVTRAAREPGTFVPDPALPTGVVEIDLTPAAPQLDVARPATLRIGERALRWEGSGVRFEGLAGARGLRPTVAGAYLAEGAAFDVPAAGPGGQVALRVIPVDTAEMAAPLDRYFEMRADADAFVLWWRQGNYVVSEDRVPRAAPREVLVATIRRLWEERTAHKDPADDGHDRAVVRFAAGAAFQDVLPLVEATLAPTRPVMLEGQRRAESVFLVSVQPPGAPISR
jgi:hypothetical protein